LSAPGDDGQGDGKRRGPVWRGYADHADDLPAVCALITLAFMLDAARLAAAAKAAGSGRG
jgi:hypothetical protein